MANPTVTFNFESSNITVQCLKTETMRTIIQRFETKIQQSADSYMYLYSGNQVNLDLTFEQQANHLDRESNQMIILVYKTESNGFKCPYCAKKIKLGEDLNDIIRAYNNLKETINGIKSMLENIIKTSINNPINNQLKVINITLNTINEDIKKNNEKLEKIVNNNNKDGEFKNKNIIKDIVEINSDDINNTLKEENLSLKESNLQIKNENEDLCCKLEMQKETIEELVKDNKNLKLSTQKLGKELVELKNISLSQKKQILNLEKDKENSNKLFIKEKDILKKELNDLRFRQSNTIETKRLKENLDKLEKKLKEEQKEKEDYKIEYEEIIQKLSLINYVIYYKLDEKTSEDKYNNPGNKCLIIKLILSDTNFIDSEKVALTMLEIDRGDFAPIGPYQDRPQSINYNVTISAPHMHAFALKYLAPFCTENSQILDIGSGSGYLTCALSALTNHKGTVIGIEHIPELINFGIENIKKNHGNLLDTQKIIFVHGDGRLGCKKYGPYKAIHVGAAVEKIPIELLDQLDFNGRMFIPCGEKNNQKIYIVDKNSSGETTFKPILSVCYGMLTDVCTQLNPKK